MEETLDNKKNNNFRFNLLIMVSFFTGVLLILSTYAWFYATLDVKIDFFKLTVSDESGLFASLDGITFGSEIEITRDNIIDNLKETYPNHVNQWASNGLYAVSTVGITDTNQDKFVLFGNSRLSYRLDHIDDRNYLNSKIFNENESSIGSSFLAFDLFLKNVSGSPYDDNLYFTEGTGVYAEDDEFNGEADGTINSTRIGIIKIGTVPKKTPVADLQNITCNSNCSTIIYEPNSTRHSYYSIIKAQKYNVKLIDGVAVPTFAVIKEGKYLDIASGQEGNIELDAEHFAYQNTIKDFDDPIFTIGNGITKVRVYVWVEGQDMDSIESQTYGAPVKIVINFYKDLAGYYY